MALPQASLLLLISTSVRLWTPLSSRGLSTVRGASWPRHCTAHSARRVPAWRVLISSLEVSTKPEPPAGRGRVCRPQGRRHGLRSGQETRVARDRGSEGGRGLSRHEGTG